MKKTPAVKVEHLVNWYYGNYCTRKCYNDEKRQEEHMPKLQELATKMNSSMMTPAQFLELLRSDKTICDLSDEEWNNRRFSWKNTDCIICKWFGIH